jgi:hypothetical protein
VRFAYIAIGFLIVILLLPICNTVWRDSIVPILVAYVGSTPGYMLFYTMVPYLVIGVLIVIAFLVARGKPNAQ